VEKGTVGEKEAVTADVNAFGPPAERNSLNRGRNRHGAKSRFRQVRDERHSGGDGTPHPDSPASCKETSLFSENSQSW